MMRLTIVMALLVSAAVLGGTVEQRERGLSLKSVGVRESGIYATTSEFQKELDLGPKRVAGCVYDPAVLRTFTLALEV